MGGGDWVVIGDPANVVAWSALELKLVISKLGRR